MLKIFLMTRNESGFIEDWIKYHGYLLGLENIHILDGSDEAEVLRIYSKYEKFGLNVHHSRSGLDELAEELTQLMHAHKGSNNFLMKLDTDEFLAYVDPFKAPTRNWIATRVYKRDVEREYRQIFGSAEKREPYRVLRLLERICLGRAVNHRQLQVEGIRDIVDQLPVTSQRYKASYTAFSLPIPGPSVNPARELTRFTELQFTQMKSFFHSESFLSIDLGSHLGETTGPKAFVDTGLSIIHFHATSVEEAVSRAHAVLISHGYLSEADSLPTARERLQTLLKNNPKCPSHHKVKLYLRHLDAVSTGSEIDARSLYDDYSYFRHDHGAVEIDIVRKTLDLIERNGVFV